MIRHTLRKPIKRMKGVARIWSRHDPFMMGFMQRLIDQRMVQSTMDPIDEEIREADEEWELENVVQGEWSIRRAIVEFCQATDFAKEEGGGEDCHYRERDESLADLKPDLILEVFGVGESCMVEDEDVGEGSAEEVDDGAEEPEDINGRNGF